MILALAGQFKQLSYEPEKFDFDFKTSHFIYNISFIIFYIRMSSYVPTTFQEVRTGEISKVSMLRKLRPIVIDHRCFEAWLGLLFHYSLQFISKKKPTRFLTGYSCQPLH